MENKKRLIAVVGPTASGKTSLSIELAKKYDGEIVSADSMQIYTGMNIATAKPTKEEMQGIPHHLMDFLSPTENFSVSEYVSLAKTAVEDIISREKMPIMCGGTGLYFNSFVDNVKFSEEKSDDKLRAELKERYINEGGEILIKELSEFDEETAKILHPNNGKRIIRAIEIYKTTGITMSEHIRRSKLESSPYDLTAIGITYADRQKLYDRINLRVDIMLENGLLEETKEFYSQYKSNTASLAIGYKELKPYIEGKISLEEAVEKLKQETRHYAKRQLTWFRRDKRINWIEADKCDNVFAAACEIIENNIDFTV